MKKNLITYIIILSIFIFTKTNAELIKPSSSIEPYKVVKIQLTSLMKNNYPKKDTGIEQTWQFAHPNNQRYTEFCTVYLSLSIGRFHQLLILC